MAGASLLTLLDDIASVLDDVALMTKVAAKKTAGVLGDDLALNAEQVSGVRAERELPVVWAVAKGSFRNKLILVPAAIAISALIPWLITPLLMLGGAYLCFEGAEKLVHKFLPHEEEAHQAAPVPEDLAAYERQKVKGAIRTDFILSAEIIVIALGTVQGSSLGLQIAVVAGIALLMTVGVYGLVGLIVKLDDIGLHLLQKPDGGAVRRAVGQGLLVTAPRLMHLLAPGGHHRDVHGRRRHSGPWLALPPSSHRRDGGHGGRPARGRRGTGRGDAHPAERPGRRGGRAGAGGGHDPGEQASARQIDRLSGEGRQGPSHPGPLFCWLPRMGARQVPGPLRTIRFHPPAEAG